MKAQVATKEKYAYEAESWDWNYNGKIRKNKRHNANTETQVYLDMLQELVPFMSKNKRFSETEVISNVIDYICDLRNILGFPQPDDDFKIRTERQRTEISATPGVNKNKRNQINSKAIQVSSAQLSPQLPEACQSRSRPSSSNQKQIHRV